MEELGEGPKHRELITDQIAERIRKIEALKITDDDINDEDDNRGNKISSTREEGRKAEKRENKSIIPKTA